MANLPASGHLSDAARTEGEMKTAFEDVRDCIAQSPSGAAESALTISTGSVTPTGALHTIETQGGTSADDLDIINQTNLPDGAWLILRLENTGRTVTITDAAGGTGQIFTPSGNDETLRDPEDKALFIRRDTAWYLVHIFQGNGFAWNSLNAVGGGVVLEYTAGAPSFVIPLGVERVLVEAVGGGGGGGNGSSSVPGGGGSAGAYCKWLISDHGGDSISMIIGSGGAGGTSGDGSPGTSTTVQVGGDTVVLPGGGGGQDSGLGGEPGSVGAMPTGAMAQQGNPGHHGSVIGASGFGGQGGASVLGGGGFTEVLATAQDGDFGGGGGGGSLNRDGGDGGGGYVRIWL